MSSLSSVIERFRTYLTLVFRTVPTNVLVGLLVVICVGTMLSLVLYVTKKGTKWSARVLLVAYMVMILILAVLARKVHPGRPFNLSLFWGYRAALDGSYDLFTQSIANVAAFVPIGLLLGCVFDRMKWWKVLLIGAGFSVLIEVLQFVFKRGFAEFDDVLHNVLGCAVGFAIYLGIERLMRERRVIDKD